MTIKEAAERTGLSADSLRYYERIGLIPPVPRRESGVRDYTEQALSWVRFALCFKRAGVSLEDIIEYIHLMQLGEATKAARREIIARARDKIAAKIAELQQTLAYAEHKLAHYDSEVVPATEALARQNRP